MEGEGERVGRGRMQHSQLHCCIYVSLRFSFFVSNCFTMQSQNLIISEVLTCGDAKQGQCLIDIR